MISNPGHFKFPHLDLHVTANEFLSEIIQINSLCLKKKNNNFSAWQIT